MVSLLVVTEEQRGKVPGEQKLMETLSLPCLDQEQTMLSTSQLHGAGGASDLCLSEAVCVRWVIPGLWAACPMVWASPHPSRIPPQR